MPFVNIASFNKYFPSRVTVPAKLIELAEWLNDSIDDENYYIPSFGSENFSEYYASNGSNLADFFGIFINLGDGSQVAYWFYEGCDVDKVPIVVLGSEGDLGIAANSIEEFIARIIEEKFPDTYWAARLSDFYFYRYCMEQELEDSFEGKKVAELVKPQGDWLNNLEEWVKIKWNLDSVSRQNLTSIDPSSNHPNIEEWFDNWNTQQEAIISDDDANQLSSCLQNYLTQNLSQIQSIEESFYRAYSEEEQRPMSAARDRMTSLRPSNFDIVLVGSKFEIYHRFYGKQQISDSNSFELIFRKIREKRAVQNPQRGFWFSAVVNLYPDGEINIICHFDDQEPNFEREQPTLDDFLIDLNQFPKSSRWIPVWLKNRLLELSITEDRYEEIVTNYASLIELENSDTESWLDRADLFAQYEKHESALQAYEKVISIDSQSYRAFYNHGNSLKRIGCLEKSINSYDQALNLEPDSASAYYNRCLSFYELKQYKNALDSCEKALLIEPDKAEALYMKTYFLYYLDRHEKSLETCNQVLKSDPDKPDILHLKCRLLFSDLKQYEDALQCCEKILLTEPDNVNVLNAKAYSLYYLQRYNESVEASNRLLSIKPNSPDILYLKGWNLGRLSQYQEALAALNKALDIEPTLKSVLEEKQSILFNLERYEDCILCNDQILHLDSQECTAMYAKALAFLRLQQYNNALIYLDQALNIQPTACDIWDARGQTLFDLERYDEALESYNHAIDYEPHQAEFLINRGNLFHEIRRYEEALANYNSALILDEACAAAHFGKSITYADQGQTELALESLQRSLHLEPNIYKHFSIDESIFENLRANQKFLELINNSKNVK